MAELFRNTLSAWQWGLLALVPPAIIALYFLKLRRRPLEVPSTYLWKKSIEDLHVNSLWQRLRRSLLLFLQLLLVALAMLALLRPGWEGTRLEGQRFIFLIDNSASMSATDTTGSANRLEEAKQLAGNLIAQMEAGTAAMIVSFSDRPQVVQEMTSNRRLLRERLEAIRPTYRQTDLHGALELARGLVQAGEAGRQEGPAPETAETAEPAETAEDQAPPATAYIFSDGRFEDVEGLSLGDLRPVYVPIGSLEAGNMAITALATRRDERNPEQRQAFVQVANFTDQPHTATVELLFDGEFLDAREVELAADDVAGTVFSLGPLPAGSLTARLQDAPAGQDAADVLVFDDRGFAPLDEGGNGNVLVVSPGNNLALQAVLGTESAGRLANVSFAAPSDLESPEYQRAAATGAYDLIVYDQCAPAEMPRANTVFLGRLPPDRTWQQPAETDDSPPAEGGEPQRAAQPQIIDWDRAHPLLAHVELGSVDLVDSLVLEPPGGARRLIDSTAGPIAAIAPRDRFQDAVLGFELVGSGDDRSVTINTNWPRRHSFPTFWLNALEHLAQGGDRADARQLRPGRPIELRVPAGADRLTVVEPGGQETTLPTGGQSAVTYHHTDQPGIYEVRVGNDVVERFAVNLFDRGESDVRVRPTQDPESQTVRPADIRIGHVDVAATTGTSPGRHELWKVLLLAALFVLLLEWYIYNRRVYL